MMPVVLMTVTLTLTPVISVFTGKIFKGSIDWLSLSKCQLHVVYLLSPFMLLYYDFELRINVTSRYVRCRSDTFILVLYDFIWYSPVVFAISTPQWLRWQHLLLATIICQIWKILRSHIGDVSLIMPIPCMDASK